MNARVFSDYLEPAADWAGQALDELLARVVAELAPPPPLSIVEWAEEFRVLSAEESADYSGRYNLDMTPALRGILWALSEPGVRRVVVQKSAQLGYTAGVVCNLLAYHIHWRPSTQVVMFPREMSAKDFANEKFDPMVRATPVLAERVQLRRRSDGNSTTRKVYPGGRIKLVASKSPSDIKSTSARVLIVEEPDDTTSNVKGQGDSITVLRNRKKTVTESIELIGGSPTAKGASKVEKEIRVTDQRHFYVACHACGEEHEPDWHANVTIPGANLTDEELSAPDVDIKWPLREVYGRARWEDAFYSCPHCGVIWTQDERVANIRAAASKGPLFGWRPTAEADHLCGFYCSELLSVFPGSAIPLLAERYLEAKHYLDRGEPEKMIDFVNGTLGQTWEYKGELPEEDELRARAEPYAEMTAPQAALVPLMYVDVQHNRVAVTVYVVGRGEEMWLAYWGEFFGQTVVAHAGAWLELEQALEWRVQHSTGARLPIAAVGIDSGDGQTTDAVYAFVRRHHRRDRPVYATKGASDKVGRIEIWTPARAVDPNARSTKATRSGVMVHIIGAAKAKDLILGWATEAGRIRLAGNGPGRMHWYKGVRDDYYEQMLGEMKIPSRFDRNVREWRERTDRAHEALDCTVGIVWLCRHLRLHLRKPLQWQLEESRIRQAVLALDDAQDAPPPHAAAADAAAPKPAVESAPAMPAPAPHVPPPATAKPRPARAPALASDEWMDRL